MKIFNDKKSGRSLVNKLLFIAVLLLTAQSSVFAQWSSSTPTVGWYGDSPSLTKNATLLVTGRFTSASAQANATGVSFSMVNSSSVTRQTIGSINSSSLADAKTKNDYIYADLVIGVNGLRINEFRYNQISSNATTDNMQIAIVDLTTNIETVITGAIAIDGTATNVNVPLTVQPQLIPGRTYRVKWYFFRPGTTANHTSYIDNPSFTTQLNSNPVANNDTYNPEACATAAGTFVSNDTDPEGHGLTVDQINETSFTVGSNINLTNGVLNISNATTGAFTFVPNDRFTGAQTFTYRISDGFGGTSTATVTINVLDCYCANPIFSVSPGTYNSAQTVGLSSTTSSASIRYTTDGTNPSSTTGTLYSSPVSISSNTTLKAITYKSGMNDSEISSGTYVIKCAIPTFNPVPGTYNTIQTIAISSSTSGASIKYTTDGSLPSESNGSLYSAPITVSSTTTVKAIAYKTGNNDSEIASALYTIELIKVDSPEFNPLPGTYSTAQLIAISSSTSGASIRYTTDGTNPSATTGTLYSSPVSISSNTTLKAIAYKSGMNDSEISSGTYVIKCAIPTFDPVPGTYNTIQTIAISSSTSGTSIKYTTDGSTPSQSNGSLYSSPITVSSTTTVKAIAYKTGNNDSEIASALYTIELIKVDSPEFNPLPGTYSTSQLIAISSSTSGASIRYTTDGTNPSATTGTLYSSPVSISSNTTLKAIAYKSGMNNSDIISGTYSIKCAIPTFNPVPDTYNTTQTITLSSTTSGASIRYTTDGTNPSATTGTLYSSPVSISSNTTLKAIAYKSGMIDSEIISGTYSIKCAIPIFNPVPGTYNTFQTIAISSSTSGVSIRYTTDGSLPSESNGTLYNAPFTVTSTATVKAIAFKTGNLNSDITGGLYTIELIATDAPVFNPLPGTYSTAQLIAISSSTSGASIRYTTDGTNPSATTGELYSSLVSISSNTTLKAIAYKSGMNNSEITSGTYSIKCGVPAFSPLPGTYNSAQTVSLSSSTSGASIKYTVDGSNPSESNGTLYSAPFTVSSTATVKAIAFKTGNLNSDITGGLYSIEYIGTAPPVFNPLPGTYNTTQTVSLSSTTSGASIRYTVDGSNPSSTSGTIYTTPVSISSNLTLKAIAYKSGNLDSEVISGVYVIKCGAPVFSPLPGTYTSAQTVSITCSTSEALIRYTLDGSNPSEGNGTLYSAPITVSSTSTIKAIAFKTGNLISDISSGLYSIQIPVVAAPVFSPGGGSYYSAQSVTITSTTAGASIRYTIDGSEPSITNGAVYNSPVQIYVSGTLKAIAYKSGMIESQVSSASYAIQAEDSDADGVINSEDDYPSDPNRAYSTFYPANGFGTLAFEDLWPSKGDYDFNDLVVHYNFKIVTNAQNTVVELKSTFHVVAVGASLKNGFGFQIDGITPDKIASVTGQSNSGTYIQLNSNGTESNQAKAVIIAIDNIDNVLHRAGGSMFNTNDNSLHGTADTVNILISFTSPITLASLGSAPFNPFLIKGLNRAVEIHLADKAPTSLASTAYFRTLHDDSNPGTGRYYKTVSNLPWAINIPEPFDYPFEKIMITDAYLHFGEWAESSGSLFQDWYQDKTGYRNSSKIY